jgi:dual specificity tyrosine-phosphorylation-regulated kinase 2/3/4
LTYLDENPEKNVNSSGIYNFGFDNDQADFLYEAKDSIAYRYEIQKKLGRGAFGVVLKCFDHKTKEYCAVKVLKNWKKLHKQGKIEIKILETLRDSDHEN